MGTQTRTWSPQQNAIFQWFEKNPDYFINNTDVEFEISIDVDGNLIVRARAGTGKTTVILEGVKRAPERKTLVCAFSKVIQLELEARIGKDHPWIHAKTLHSVGFACVNRFRQGIKVSFKGERADALTDRVCGNNPPDTIKKLVTRLHTLGRETCPHAKNPGDLTELAIKFECEPGEEWEQTYPLAYVEARALEAMELAAGVKNGETIDGSDMIFLPVRNGWLVPMYDLVVVDEAQDMTTAQLEIAQGVLKPGGRMCIVGDDCQAIFGFRGADSESLDRLKMELGAGELGLTVTYRCGKSIVELAQRLVPDFEAAATNGDGEILYKPMDALYTDAGPGDFILSRINAPLVTTAMRLLKQGKRTRIMGNDIGKGLINLIRKFKATSVPNFLTKVESWCVRESSRVETQIAAATNGRKKALQSKLEGIAEKAEMLTSLAEGAKNVQEVLDRIEHLFSDNKNTEGMITCSSVHRAKGLEANRVFVMKDTIRYHTKEENNIEYVAITRAKNTLVFVSDKYCVEEN